MTERYPFDVSYASAVTCEKMQVVAGFLEHRIADHFRDRFASPLMFMPDPRHPALYDAVRGILKGRAGDGGTFEGVLHNAKLTFRVLDDGDKSIGLELVRPQSIRPSPIETKAATSAAP